MEDERNVEDQVKSEDLPLHSVDELGLKVLSPLKLVWIQELLLSLNKEFIKFDGSISDSFSGDKYEWGGADWTLIVQHRGLPYAYRGLRTFNVYLQIAKPPSALHLPLCRKVNIKFYLMNTNGIDACITACDLTHTYNLEHDSSADIGRSEYFNINFLGLNDDKNGFIFPPSSRLDSILLPPNEKCIGSLHIAVIVEAMPLYPKISWSYNSKEETKMVGLCNLGATCYLNALLQMLYHIPAFRRAVYHMPVSDDTEQSSITFALQCVFRNLQCESKEVSTVELTRAFGWTSSQAFLQQDVQEMMRILLDKLEELMKGTAVDGSISNLFKGNTVSYIRCLNIEFESRREEDFYDIQLDVSGNDNMHESFRQYTAKELLNEDNQYDTGDGRGKQDAEKGIVFSILPPVLTIHLKRFQFDLRKMGFSKIHDYFSFPLSLDMKEYLSLEAQQNETDSIYLLHSVLVHSGDVGGGHYYAFIRPDAADYDNAEGQNNGHTESKWYKFDDETVTLASEVDAVQRNFGRRKFRRITSDVWEDLSVDELGGGMDSVASAYMLVYVRRKEIKETMRSVSVDDIPNDLSAKVEAEARKIGIGEKIRDHEKSFETVQLFDERAISSWSTIELNNDLYEEKAAVDLRLMKKDYSSLGLMYLVADTINVPPYRLILYVFEETNLSSVESDEEDEAITTRLQPLFIYPGADDNMKLLYDSTRLYVHVFPTVHNENELYSTYIDLRYEMQNLLDEVRTDLQDPAEYDWLLGCGIGRGFDYLKGRLRFGPFSEDITSRFVSICKRANDFITNRKLIHKDDILVFFRAYDLHNELPLLPDNHADFRYRYLSSQFIRCEGDISGLIREHASSIFDELLEDLPKVHEKWSDIDIYVAKSPTTLVDIDDTEFDLINGDIIYCCPKDIHPHEMDIMQWNNFQIFKKNYTLRAEGHFTVHNICKGLQISTDVELIHTMTIFEAAQAISKATGVAPADNIIFYGSNASSKRVQTRLRKTRYFTDNKTFKEDIKQVKDFEIDTIHFSVCPFVNTADNSKIFIDLLIADVQSRDRLSKLIAGQGENGHEGKRRRLIQNRNNDILEPSFRFITPNNLPLCLNTELAVGDLVKYVRNRLDYSDEESLFLFTVNERRELDEILVESNTKCVDDALTPHWVEVPPPHSPLTIFQKLNVEDRLQMHDRSNTKILITFSTRSRTNKMKPIDDVYYYTPFVHYIREHDSYADLYRRLSDHCNDLGIEFSEAVAFQSSSMPQLFDAINADGLMNALRRDSNPLITLLIKDFLVEETPRKAAKDARNGLSLTIQ